MTGQFDPLNLLAWLVTVAGAVLGLRSVARYVNGRLVR